MPTVIGASLPIRVPAVSDPLTTRMEETTIIARDAIARDGGQRMKTLYEAKATATGGRNGHVRTSDGILDMDLSIPKGLGGPGAPLPNPEQLFAAGYAACFDSALAYVAAQRKVKLNGSTVNAAVSIGPREGGGFALAVRLEIRLPEIPREQAQELVNAAHAACPYSNAVRNNIPVDVQLA